ncbi:MAG: YqgE/AlgH family protein [Luteitalea sp.]|nr:YqgE/AlgH family protein [Acidobacteriota bacterium]
MDAPDQTSSLAPTLLLSMPQMHDPNFERTVVLLCDHSTAGAFGLVLNRPTTTAAAEVVAFDPPVDATQGPLLWTGGPVEPQRGWILLGESLDEDEVTEVAPGLFLSTSIQLLRRILGATPSRTRVLTGYAGWGPGQLDDELAASAWLTVDVDPALIFDTPADEMWDRAIRRLGTEPGSLQIGQGVH